MAFIDVVQGCTPRIRNEGLRWSRRWFEHAPDGTIVKGVEIRRDGRWEPL